MTTATKTVGKLLAFLGSGAGTAAAYLAAHPRVAIFLGTMVISGLVGWVIVGLALLVQPMQGVFLLLYMLMGSGAVLSGGQDQLLSRRLWVGMLTSVMGLLAMRVIYHDLLGLQLDPVFRSNLIGIFGLVCGVTGFLKVR